MSDDAPPNITPHTYFSLIVSEIGDPEIIDTMTGSGIAFKCVAYDPFDDRFSCCNLSLEVADTVTWSDADGNLVSKDEIKTCPTCGRMWCRKHASWATLVRTDGLP